MSAALAFPTVTPATNALLRAQLFRVERSLVATRQHVLSVLDQELANVRSCLATVPATQGEGSAVSEKEAQLKAAPQYQIDNIVQMNPFMAATQGAGIPEAELDPKLVQATVDELNAALKAAFCQVAEL